MIGGNLGKTISLAMIVKNEAHNIPRLFESIEGCFNEIHITDTGSTDDTIKVIESLAEKHKGLGTEIFIHNFKWVDDFSAARNYSFSHCTTDFIMWMDGDDTLTNKADFILWRDNAMEFADYWLATYDYAHDSEGKPLVSFARERVVKRSCNPVWQYFIHEGIVPNPGSQVQYAVTWKMSHHRTVEDIARDKGRNIKIFERHIEKLKESGQKLPSRMMFYYGKELFESQKPMEAFTYLLEASQSSDIEPHDKIMALQYSVLASMQCNQYERALAIAHTGIQLDVQRGELWSFAGDCLIQMKRIADAIPYYAAAMKCNPPGKPGDKYAGAAFNFQDSYTKHPRNSLVKCYFNLGRHQEALDLALETQKLYPNDETAAMIQELDKVKIMIEAPKVLSQNDESIVITCPPNGLYEWDEEIYKTKGMGGSETAAIEMARNLKKLTGRPVKVFNKRDKPMVADSGVEYLPANGIPEYMMHHKPKMHIAWRHNFKTTDAKTYLWCHDLVTPTVESVQNFDKIMCLTPFHKRYVRSMQGIKDDKVFVTRNGINPARFIEKSAHPKDPMKIVFPSSPDRGLDRAIQCLDLVREKYPVQLHVFYGFENLYKSGPQMSELADKLKAMIKEREWITYHGFTEQDKLMEHFKTASIWLHPANFIETFCITALEMLSCGVYPITRTLGALQDTLGAAARDNMAYLFEEDCVTEEQRKRWADKVCEVIENESWNKVHVNPEQFSWESVAKEWIKEMDL